MSDEIEWTPVKVRLGDLSHWADNPVTLTKAQAGKLLRSKEKLGKMQTLAIGPSNGDGKYPLYDGHQRANVWGAAFGMGLEVWALQSSRALTDEERHAVPIMLRTAVGSLDWDALAGWTDYPISEWGLDDDALQGLKFDIAALGNLLESEQEPPKDAEPQIDRAEELNEKWQVKMGDLWRIGENRLLCGDSTRREDVERAMQGERARLEFSDPPYDFETEGGGILSESRHMDAIQKAGINIFDPLSIELLAGTSVFCCNKVLVPAYIELANKNNQVWDLCFYKKENTPPNFGRHLMTDTEYLPVIGKQSPNSGMEKAIYSKAYIGGLDDAHLVAWQKPLGLVEKFIRLFSMSGHIIIDRFAGTGTTIVACQNLGRKCRAIEISPAYCAVMLERMATAFPGIEIERIG